MFTWQRDGFAALVSDGRVPVEPPPCLVLTQTDVTPLTLDLESKSKNGHVNPAAEGFPAHLNDHHMVTPKKQTASEWRLCSSLTLGPKGEAFCQ